MLPEGTSRMPGLGTHAEGRMPILRPRWGSRRNRALFFTNICLLSKVIQKSSMRGDDLRRGDDVLFIAGGTGFTSHWPSSLEVSRFGACRYVQRSVRRRG